ncbi:MAG: PilZ domain-containing protein, partial [Deltaproteobacteria bacterium]|nr:PilZ domain-containing protein [Deltaproteobacteria bacterium]
MPVVLPVFFQLLNAEGKAVDAEIRAAFTEDVSGTGLRLQIRHLPASLKERLQETPPDLRMQLDMPLPHKRIRVESRVAWCRPDDKEGSDAVFVGIEFANLSREHGDEMLAVARRAVRRPKIRRMILAGLSLGLLLSAGALWWNHERHLEEEKAMTEKLVDATAKYDALSASIEERKAHYNSTAATI